MNLQEWKKYNKESGNILPLALLDDWEADREQLVERIISLTAEVNNLFNETVMLSNHD